jgi:hypothetical protein
MDTDNDDLASLSNFMTLDGTPVLTRSSKHRLSSFVAELCLSLLAFPQECRLNSYATGLQARCRNKQTIRQFK